jgi:NAD(P)-dependent dehydrogenase (short-subunit alcohol dehydrogenase family)
MCGKSGKGIIEMNIIITGASSGLGKLIARFLYPKNTIIDWSLNTGVDVTSVSSIEKAIIKLPESVKKVHTLVNCAGVNYIDWIPKLTEDDWDRLMNTNARAMFSTVRRLLPMLQGGTVCNIISNASHLPMTHSLAYNASKGVAHILTLQMARELKKTHDITVFGVSPNKLKGTAMSTYIGHRVRELRGWTQEQADAYQLAALPAGEETNPAQCAEFIGWLLSTKARHKFLNGCILPYGA